MATQRPSRMLLLLLLWRRDGRNSGGSTAGEDLWLVARIHRGMRWRQLDCRRPLCDSRHGLLLPTTAAVNDEKHGKQMFSIGRRSFDVCDERWIHSLF